MPWLTFHHLWTGPMAPPEREGRKLTHALFAGAMLLPICAPAVGGGFQVLLRNDLTRGSFVSYRVRAEGVRSAPTLRYVEKLTFTQSGRLTLVVLEADKKKQTARRAWMMELEEPVVVSLARDGEAVEDLPPPRTVGLPPKAAQLRVGDIDLRRASASPVGGSLVQRAALLLALDFAHWPDELVRPGDAWESAVKGPVLEGVWTHHYAKTEGARSKRLAVGDFRFEGRLVGRFAGVATIKEAAGTWKWRVAKRALHSSSADVLLSYGGPGRSRTLAMHVELEMERRERLPRPLLLRAIEELAELNTLARGAGGAGGAGATDDLARFVETHADSPWMPVARDLLERVEFDARVLGELGRAQLIDALTRLITRWQLAAMAGNLEPLQPLRATFRRLVKTNREELHGLTVAEDPSTRAMAVFCVAFGAREEDRARVLAACEDSAARVRAWAAYGLAERRDINVEPAVLRALLADADDKVRQRACMAVQACVGRNSLRRPAFFELLLRIVGKDESDAVRARAAEALNTLALPSDLPALIDAEYEQEVPAARRQLEATIRQLGGEPREVPGE